MADRAKPVFPMQMPIDGNGNPTGPSAPGLSKLELFALVSMHAYRASSYQTSESEQVAKWAVKDAIALVAELERS